MPFQGAELEPEVGRGSRIKVLVLAKSIGKHQQECRGVQLSLSLPLYAREAKCLLILLRS